MKRFALVLMMLSGVGCATNFTGRPHFPGGSKGCQAKCQGEGLEMGAFVYAGEFSTACVCRPRGAAAPAAASATASADDAGTSAAVGVMTQMRAAQNQQRQQ